MFAIQFLPEAEAEFREAVLWYFERSPLAADAFRNEVLDAIDRLVPDPLIWPADSDDIRKYVLRRFPYTVRYLVSGSLITVLAVAHQRRHPGYWRKR